MIDSRKKMLERVRAVLSKTIANGCTEGEAMAALDKARELMAAYDLSEADLGRVAEGEAALIHKGDIVDPHGIKPSLCRAVGQFTRCEAWRGIGTGYGVAFCGLESDVLFATWMLETLRAFVERELKAHQATRRAQGFKNPRIISASFVMGACNRIAERLRQLTPVDPVSASTGNALTVSRNALIDAAMAAAGIKLKDVRSRSRNVDRGSFDAGKAAGNSARFDRPVGSGGWTLLGQGRSGSVAAIRASEAA
jgi:hypothetical protein